jgi:hypothetical protein
MEIAQKKSRIGLSWLKGTMQEWTTGNQNLKS